ncbi:hypothetical protein [Hydrogenophaga pseudoflava]|uniref:hypothetical protein n=1 Tax=Hydrogenophaga pseudoflava TaxID=47421 RepID=UPI0027E41704|nr:hypothetical protein [Hydrogenophaga pseudoflava]MDQ7743629.1 hypothetical protein [Hydrogenophaga pseudoflava]
MCPQTRELFTESAYGALPQPDPRLVAAQTTRPAATEPPTFVETLGFPKGTPPLPLAQVLEDIRATAPGTRVNRLLAPGTLSRLFSQEAAQASYALAILSIVESPDFESTLARLRAC